MYEIVGDYPAQDFFSVNGTTGQVTIEKDLREDATKTLQYMVCCDI